MAIAVPGDCQVTAEMTGSLVAREIRSSVAFAVAVPSIGLAGLLRFAYPDSAANPVLAEENPCLFADTGLAELLSQVRAHGISDGDLRLYACGAAALAERTQGAEWAKANELALKKILWRERLYLAGEDLGGDCARSLWVDASGRIIIRSEKQRAAAAAQGLRHAV
jgi:chemotaxis receptor (MCP) glutamine deamidase CheD